MTRLFRRPATYLILALVLFVAHVAFYAWLMDFDAVDDAYISFRYAYNAARGHGLTFNIGERRVEGYTNFLWTVLMIPFFWLKIPVQVPALLLGTLWAAGCMVLILRLARQKQMSGHWWGIIAIVFLAADGSFALWAVGGLEGPFFSFLILAGGLAYLREMRNPHVVPISGVWFALAAMTRPEGLLVYGVTGIHQIASRLIRERKLVTVQDWRRLGLFLIVWVPWFAFRWRYYGFPLPNTFYAKVSLGDTTAQRLRGLDYVGTFIRIHLGYIPLVLALVPLLNRRSRMWSSYFTLLVLIYGGYIAYVGGDWSVGRFFVPLMPFFYMLLAGGLFEVAQRLVHFFHMGDIQSKSFYRVAAALIVVLGVAGLFWQSSLNGEKALFLDPFDAQLAGRARTAMGKWLYDNVPHDTYIAVDAAGQMPFYADLKALDLYGLNDLTIAHSQVENMGSGTPGHEKMNMDYVIFVAQPDYIIIYGTAFDWLEAFSYKRVDLDWTSDPQLKQFLGVYQRQ